MGLYSNAHINDKKEFIPAVESVLRELGTIKTAVDDTGYFSQTNVVTVQEQRTKPLIATGKEQHNSFLEAALNRSRNNSQPRQ